jgi:hypothetical protein
MAKGGAHLHLSQRERKGPAPTGRGKVRGYAFAVVRAGLISNRLNPSPSRSLRDRAPPSPYGRGVQRVTRADGTLAAIAQHRIDQR